MTDENQTDNQYFMQQENTAELSRLLEQDKLTTSAMGGLLPPEIDIQEGWSVLDIGCGPGGWPVELAYQYHETNVTVRGVDIDPEMIHYAQAQALEQDLDNLVFEVMNVAELPWQLPDASFDFVNVRFLGFFSPSFWPMFVRECARVTRPGGVIRLTETEMHFTTSPAVARWTEWFFQALKGAGQSFSPNGHQLAITAMLVPLLRQAGLANINTRAYDIEWSAGTQWHRHSRENVRRAARLIEPFFLAQGLVESQADLDANYEQMIEEMQQIDFAAVTYMRSGWGWKPGT